MSVMATTPRSCGASALGLESRTSNVEPEGWALRVAVPSLALRGRKDTMAVVEVPQAPLREPNDSHRGVEGRQRRLYPGMRTFEPCTGRTSQMRTLGMCRPGLRRVNVLFRYVRPLQTFNVPARPANARDERCGDDSAELRVFRARPRPRTSNLEPRTSNLESLEPRTSNLEPRQRPHFSWSRALRVAMVSEEPPASRYCSRSSKTSSGS